MSKGKAKRSWVHCERGSAIWLHQGRLYTSREPVRYQSRRAMLETSERSHTSPHQYFNRLARYNLDAVWPLQTPLVLEIAMHATRNGRQHLSISVRVQTR